MRVAIAHGFLLLELEETRLLLIGWVSKRVSKQIIIELLEVYCIFSERSSLANPLGRFVIHI